MDYRSILNFVNSPGADAPLPSPTSSETSRPVYGDVDPNNNVVKKSGVPVCGGCCITIRDRWILKTSGVPVCGGCCITIRDRWILKVGDQPYHMACLRCSVCLRTLDNHTSCFIRDNAVYCRFHYVREYGTKCSGCSDYLMPTDWIQRARDLTYHVGCFCCYVCKRLLHTGDTVVAKDDLIVCYEHRDASLHVDECDSISISSIDSDSRSSDFDERVTRRTTRGSDLDPARTRDHEDRARRRARSTFTSDQVHKLQSAFMQKQMPTSEEQEMLAHELGLTKKVVGVWFQNTRARSKKGQSITSSAFFNKRTGKPFRYTNSPVHIVVRE